jgi:hypothetical protein
VTTDKLTTTLTLLYGETNWPKPLSLLRGAELARESRDIKSAARAVNTTAKNLSRIVESRNPIREVLSVDISDITPEDIRRAKQILGNLLLGRCAEIAFENIYREEMRTHELHLEDLRESRNDTDYRVMNGQGRKVYRLNIKFHGSPFRRAMDLVHLDPEDCFALATYKIHSAQEKQADERLPYIFAIVGVHGLSAEAVGERIPHHFVNLIAILHKSKKAQRKRDVEDLVIEYFVAQKHEVFNETYDLIRCADWYILSANKAIKLVREKLFERVFALRLRSFARVFGRAELDMHFSLRQDLTPLSVFLKTLREEGPTKVAAMLTNGDY